MDRDRSLNLSIADLSLADLPPLSSAHEQITDATDAKSRRSKKRMRQKANQTQKAQNPARPTVMLLALSDWPILRASMDALTRSSRPSTVLVIESTITSPQHTDIACQLMVYAQEGGRVMLCGQFAGNFDYRDGPAFWRRWGVPWQLGSYHYTSLILRPTGTPAGLDAHALDPSCELKATFIRGAAPRDIVYVISLTAPLPPHLAQQPTVARLESPAVWTPIGQGFLGFCGAANTEVASTKLLIEMCGVKAAPVDFEGEDGQRMVGVEIGPFARYVTPIYEPAAAKNASERGKMPARSGVQAQTPAGARAVARGNTSQKKRSVGEGLKNDGNNLFKRGEYALAAQLYREAARQHAPKPVYLTNLAVALLKIKRWEAAESAADRALRGDPANLKARYRRGLARRGQKKYLDAIRDFRCMLDHEPTSEDAQRELDATLPLLSGQAEEEDYDDPPYDDSCAWEVLTQSDTEDSRHTASSNKPCQAYNRAGCSRATACLYVHAPD
ncbi:hypothetical protein CERSUDRAFT_124543 [Gelatoporia subvermispora B]|uniref:C3H1-type domain-containing protein n=1 Tax=Ceriporiopsis subvermispora (strain B) TaxID=914234 RepID=M2RB48_CERS8|nr:hypothetical protein CERSUDRAFT_124543 [Gelatoporia subvermispora B]